MTRFHSRQRTGGAPLFLAGLALMTPPAVAAQVRDSARDSTASRLPEIVVRSVKPITTVGGASALRLELDSLAIPPAPSLELVLRELPLLHVRRNSRGEGEISARGSESRQVAILVDGIPITLAWDARADVSIIPAGAPERIEFTRGLSSMLYGPNVLGGIVEITVGHSLRQPTRTSLLVASGIDRHGSFASSGAISAPFASSGGRWLVRAGMGFSDSPGQPLASGIVEPTTPDDDLRLNTDSRAASGFGSIRFQAHGGAWFSATASSFAARRGIAAELGVDQARFWRYPHVNRSIGIVSAGTGHRKAFFGGVGDIEASVGVDVGRTDIDSYTSRAYTELAAFEDGKDLALTTRILADHTLGARGDLRAAFTFSEIRHDEYLPAGSARYRQRLMSSGFETTWRLIENGAGINSFRVSVGGAYDIGKTPESGGREALGTVNEWGGRVGFTMGLGSGETQVHGGISRRGRFPALRELYSGALNRFAPNPDLTPENLVALEAGVTRRIGRGEVQAVAFRHQVNDAVVRITLPDRRFMRVNRNRLLSRGVELLATGPLGPVTVSADLTAQSVDLTDPVAAVTNRPENLPELFGSVRARATLAWGLVGGGDVVYTGTQSCIHPGTGLDTNLAGGAIVNAELSRTFGLRSTGLLTNLQARVAVDNIGNRALYDQCGLPQPGRLLRLELRVF